MGFADFWDNITTPGFLSASFDELKDMCEEFKEEARELIEEGEEIFTDGFNEMVIRDNDAYKTSIQKRADGRAEIENVQKGYLSAKGVTPEGLPFVEILSDEFKLIIEAIEKSEEADIEETRKELQGNFENLIIKAPGELRQLQQQTVELLELPEPPSYQPPSSRKNLMIEGPVEMSTSTKRKRVEAADKYLEDIEKYREQMDIEIEKQRGAGPLFNRAAISDEQAGLVDGLAKLYWEVSTSRSMWKFAFMETDAEAQMEQERKKQRRILMAMAAAIYTVASCAMVDGDSRALGKEINKELQEVKEMVDFHVDVNENEVADNAAGSCEVSKSVGGLAPTTGKGDPMFFVSVLTEDLKSLADHIAAFKESDVSDVNQELQGNFEHLHMVNSQEVADFHAKAVAFLGSPYMAETLQHVQASDLHMTTLTDEFYDVMERLQRLSRCFWKVKSVETIAVPLLKLNNPHNVDLSPEKQLRMWLLVAAGICSAFSHLLVLTSGGGTPDNIDKQELAGELAEVDRMVALHAEEYSEHFERIAESS